jgi:hypothetical protein
MLTNIDLVGVGIVWAKGIHSGARQKPRFLQFDDKEESLAITVNPNALPKDASMIFLLMFDNQ